jgi:hypothetical protein
MSEEIKLDLEYSEALRLFRKSVVAAIQLHARVRNLPLQGVAPTARLMFARITFLACSISKLCPEVEDGRSIWDFTSIALLARSLFESILLFRYFAAPADPDEWMARMLVLHLHDRCERIRLFEKLKRTEDVTGFQGEVLNLKEFLRDNPFIQSLEVKRQKEILNGSRASILSLSEMGDRYAPDNDTWTIHQFLSHYAHSHPVSFMRNDDQRRDGLANDIDKMYIPGVLRWLASSIEGAIEAYGHIPSGLWE